jgi:hypothetical protein
MDDNALSARNPIQFQMLERAIRTCLFCIVGALGLVNCDNRASGLAILARVGPGCDVKANRSYGLIQT